MLNFLIESGAITTSQNDNGQTPLHLALKKVNFAYLTLPVQTQFLELLIRSGKEIDIVDAKEKSALQYAEEYQPKLISLLQTIVAKRKINPSDENTDVMQQLELNPQNVNNRPGT